MQHKSAGNFHHKAVITATVIIELATPTREHHAHVHGSQREHGVKQWDRKRSTGALGVVAVEGKGGLARGGIHG